MQKWRFIMEWRIVFICHFECFIFVILSVSEESHAMQWLLISTKIRGILRTEVLRMTSVRASFWTFCFVILSGAKNPMQCNPPTVILNIVPPVRRAGPPKAGREEFHPQQWLLIIAKSHGILRLKPQDDTGKLSFWERSSKNPMQCKKSLIIKLMIIIQQYGSEILKEFRCHHPHQLKFMRFLE